MSGDTSILVFIFGTFLFTVFAVFTMLFIALQKKKQHQHIMEKQEMEHKFSSQLMLSKLEVQEQTLKILSAELHDHIAQVLGIAKMQVHVLSDCVADNKKAMADETALLVGEAINDIRNMSHVMNGTYILKKGLHESIEKELGRISKALRIKCNFIPSGEVFGFSEDKELILFRVIQECVANAVKHGAPYSIKVLLNYLPGKLNVEITDDGRGFEPEKQNMTDGIGLINIRERIMLLKGEVTITSVRSKGTHIQLYIPQ